MIRIRIEPEVWSNFLTKLLVVAPTLDWKTNKDRNSVAQYGALTVIVHFNIDAPSAFNSRSGALEVVTPEGFSLMLAIEIDSPFQAPFANLINVLYNHKVEMADRYLTTGGEL